MPHNHKSNAQKYNNLDHLRASVLKDKFAQCAQEWDVTYTPSWSKLPP
jgi:hypothetical protein